MSSRSILCIYSRCLTHINWPDDPLSCMLGMDFVTESGSISGFRNKVNNTERLTLRPEHLNCYRQYIHYSIMSSAGLGRLGEIWTRIALPSCARNGQSICQRFYSTPRFRRNQSEDRKLPVPMIASTTCFVTSNRDP